MCIMKLTTLVLMFDVLTLKLTVLFQVTSDFLGKTHTFSVPHLI